MFASRDRWQECWDRLESVRSCHGGPAPSSEENDRMPKTPAPRSTQRHISVVAVANSTASTLFGIYDVLAYVENQSLAATGSAPFHVDIVGEATGPLALASGVTVNVQRAIDTLDASDILIVPS